MDDRMPLSDRHLAGLLEARTGLSAYVHQSEREARALGTTHAQHHVMLALHRDGAGPTVKDIADTLKIASPSAVELVRRMAASGLLERRRDLLDRRVTRLTLTDAGTDLLHRVSEGHLPRLRMLHSRGVELLGPAEVSALD
jgi:DNA-binding MarR family transcriptional regulator